MKQQRKQKSFTLIELMVVIAIIVILAAIAIPAYINMTRRANKASVGSNLGVLATGLGAYYTDWYKYPVSLTAVNVAEVTGSFYKEFTGTGGVNNRGAGAAYLSAATLKNLRNPFYPSDPAHGLMYVSDETGTHYCLFAKISNAEGVTAFNPFGIQNVYATEGPVPETGSYLYRTDTSSNLGSSSWAALTAEGGNYPGEMRLTITISPAGAGSVTMDPSGGSYAAGTAVTLTETPAAGSSFTAWTGAGTGTSTTTTVTMTGNKTVTANFAISTFTLTYTAEAGGTITGTTPQTVNYAGSGTLVTAVPAINYHFVAWSDGITTTARTDTNVVAAKTVTATFVLDTYTITASSGSNGTVTPTGVTTKDYGDTQTYTITPYTGYSIAALTVDGSDVTLAATYTFANITINHTIRATFGYWETVMDVAGHDVSVVDVAGHDVTVTDTAAYDETVTDANAYDETVTDVAEYYITVTDTQGYTETVTDVAGHYSTVIDVAGHWISVFVSPGVGDRPDVYRDVWVADTYKQVWVAPVVHYVWHAPVTHQQLVAATTHIVHHAAVTHQVYHAAVTHQQWVDATYKNVWVDTTYKQVWVVTP